MKRIEKYALLLIAGLAITRIMTPLFMSSLVTFLDRDTNDQTIMSSILMYVSIAGMAAISIAAGVWLYHEAKKYNYLPWVWCLFGLLFKLEGVVLFYIYAIFQETMLDRKNREHAPPAGRGEAPRP